MVWLRFHQVQPFKILLAVLDVQVSHGSSLYDLSTGDVDKSSALHEEDVQVEADRRYCNGFNERQFLVRVSWITVLDGMT